MDGRIKSQSVLIALVSSKISTSHITKEKSLAVHEESGWNPRLLLGKILQIIEAPNRFTPEGGSFYYFAIWEFTCFLLHQSRIAYVI